jgi:hypothetical protein
MDIDAIVVRAAASPPAPVQRERERAEVQCGDREDEIHHAHRLTSVIKGNVGGNDARATETDR